MRPNCSALPWLIGLLGLCACAQDSPIDPPQNLLFLCVDTLRADQLGAFGGEPSLTPGIDRLATDGVVFEHALSHASWTLPSFASVLTSQYTSTHGCWTFETPLSPAFTTLPEVFSEAGFRTHGIASHIFFNHEFGLQQGFDAFDDDLAHRAGEEGWTKITSGLITDKALAWLEERAVEPDSVPWLLWLHYFDPHIPYVDHERLRDPGAGGPTTRSEFERYQLEIEYTDSQLARVLDALDAQGWSETTAVVFLSDHGESFHEHPGVFRHARSLFREELRVPLILRVPGVAPARVGAMVRTVDLLPTLLEVFGLDALEQPMEGVSLVPTLLGQAQASPPALAEIRLHDDAHHVRSFVSGPWKLIETRSGGFALYDLGSDVDERRDLSSAYPERVLELRQAMQRAIERAEARGEVFQRASFAPDADQLRSLEALGYIDGEEPEPEPDGEDPAATAGDAD